MPHTVNRRRFLQSAGVVGGCLAALATQAALTGPTGVGVRAAEPVGTALAGRRNPLGTLALNDDGYVFLALNDDLGPEDLRRYLESYCRPGVGTVAYCVGDMSWPTLYPSRIGVHYGVVRGGGDQQRWRIYRNVDRFASEPGGYFGTAFRLLHALGKKALASFRMNDAHFTSLDNPNVSEFWKQHAKHTLGAAYGYYGGCLNYESEAVRTHFYDRVVEFAALYPEIDGIELDAMRSPFFFPPDKGSKSAPLMTELIRRIKTALAAQAKRLGRRDYLLAVNVPLTPEVALECGLDVAAWDAEKLVDSVSVGTYQASMQHPIGRWRQRLAHGTPVMAYVGCSPQSGQYLGAKEYRAAAANALAAGADGVYLFNYPCLFELAAQTPGDAVRPPMALADMRPYGHADFSRVAAALEELGSAAALRGKDKRFLFYYSNEAGYRHFDPDRASLERRDAKGRLTAVLRCHDDCRDAQARTLRFKLANVARGENFAVAWNNVPLQANRLTMRYAANGRDTRIHTVKLGPYQVYETTLSPAELRIGENTLSVAPTRLFPDLTAPIQLVEIELDVRYTRR